MGDCVHQTVCHQCGQGLPRQCVDRKDSEFRILSESGFWWLGAFELQGRYLFRMDPLGSLRAPLDWQPSIVTRSSGKRRRTARVAWSSHPPKRRLFLSGAVQGEKRSNNKSTTTNSKKRKGGPCKPVRCLDPDTNKVVRTFESGKCAA